MCGIVGYYNLQAKQPVINPEAILSKAQEAIKHRGPDGYRIWRTADATIGLAHRRLSIVDLSSAAYQPMFSHDKSIVVCANGEIYNYRELKSQLEAKGYIFVSHSDTEVVAYAYQEWGIDCLHKFDGMFALVIIDLKKRQLYLVRDRIGIKPLYFSLQAGMLSFASEIKALWQFPWMQKTVNYLGAYHYLTFLSTPAPMTLYKGVYKLPAGHYAQVDEHNSVSFHKWYDPLTALINKREDVPSLNIACQTKELSHLLKQAINKRLIGDVPLGVFLSGGVDSSLITAILSEQSQQLKTFNVSFEDGPEYSELSWARKVARKYNTDHHEIIIGEKEAFNFFEKMVYHQDEPLADCVCIPLYYVAKLARDSGVKIVLSGEGSDELFCGYSLYAQYIQLYHKFWKRSAQYIPSFAKKGVFGVASHIYSHSYNRLELLKNWAENKALFWGGAISFQEVFKKDFFQYVSKQDYDPIVEQIFPGFSQAMDSHDVVHYHLSNLQKVPHNFEQSMIYLELKQRLSELLLMRLDKMTMAAGIEGRVPFLDHHLVEYALALPQEYKVHKNITKYILKKLAERWLPREVIYRKKVGFAAPTVHWFRKGTYFQPYLKDLLHSKRQEWQGVLNFDVIERIYKKHSSSQYEYSTQLWTLQNLLACKIT